MKLKPYNSIGDVEASIAKVATQVGPLSGYLGGRLRGGDYVQRLEQKWCERFGCTHAIAVNSATSGLLAACHAVDVTNCNVVVSPYTMSATASAPAFLGATLEFADIEPDHYCLDPHVVANHFTGFDDPRAVIATNLFGHPAELRTLAQLAHANGSFLIEDNAQAPFAKEHDSYAGTIGDIGVFSLNVHKHLHCGEGGMVVTDNDDFAHSIRLFINHGEMAGGPIGLNLRLSEVSAAIACAQLEKGPQLVGRRIEIAEELIDGLRHNPLITIKPPRAEARHVYYTLAMEVHHNISRDWLIGVMADYGVPLVGGYVDPLYRMPVFHGHMAAPETEPVLCPVVADLQDRSLILYENCAYDPTPEQIKEIIEIFNRVSDEAQKATMETRLPSERVH